MTLLVRDEADVLEANLRHHLDQGVDLIIATDHASQDDTPSILKRFEKEGSLRVLREDDHVMRQHEWVTRMARLAADEHGADWVLNGDADEFWVPEEGSSIPQALASVHPSVGTVVIPRLNFLPLADLSGHPLRHMIYREEVGTNELGNPLLPKVCHRASPGVAVATGNHAVAGVAGAQQLSDPPLTILHLPLRSFAQFERKISRGAVALNANLDLDPGLALAWRSMYRLHLTGRLREFWDQRCLRPDDIDARLRDGSIVEDTRPRLVWERTVAGTEVAT